MARYLSCKMFSRLIKNINYEPGLPVYKHDMLMQEKLKNLMTQNNQFCYLYNLNSQEVVLMSNNFNLLIEKKPEDKINLKHIYKLIHPNDRNTIVATTEHVLKMLGRGEVHRAQDQLYCIDFRLKKADGTYIRVLRQTNIFNHDSTGNILNVLSVYTDISNLKKTDNIDAYFFNHKTLENIPIEIKPALKRYFKPINIPVLKKLSYPAKWKRNAGELAKNLKSVNPQLQNIMTQTDSQNMYALFRQKEENNLN